MDLSQPGAFAAAASLCHCQPRAISSEQSDESNITVRLPRHQSAALAVAGRSQKLRLQRFAPTACTYASIQQLRKRKQKERSAELEKQLRTACFVGTVSHDRSLIQCSEALVLIQHYELARELFEQLALNRFGGGSGVAKLPGNDKDTAPTWKQPDDESPPDDSKLRAVEGIDIESIVGTFVQVEEILQNSPDPEAITLPVTISDSNMCLAGQVASCLFQRADMLMDYFSIGIVEDGNRRLLTGLPVLLEGYEPSPHGLPLFLLRLATEVDWTEEKACFSGVCRELGSYYAQLPSTASSEDHAAMVKHTIFPAVSTLLVPLEYMKNNPSYFATMTSLPKLYKVFERC